MNENLNLNEIDSIKKEYDNFLEIGGKALTNLNSYFLMNDILKPELENNLICFDYLGYNFVIKIEVDIEEQLYLAHMAELNLYVIEEDEKLELLLTYPFDGLGNIGIRCYLVDNFAEYFFKESITKILYYLKSKKFKAKIY